MYIFTHIAEKQFTKKLGCISMVHKAIREKKFLKLSTQKLL